MSDRSFKARGWVLGDGGPNPGRMVDEAGDELHGRMVNEILSDDPDELPIALAPEPVTRCRS